MARPRKNVQVEETKNTEVVTRAEKLTPEVVLNKLNTVQTDTQKVLAGVGASLVEALSSLNDVKAAIDVRKADLGRLRDIEVTDETLDNLNQEIEQTRLDWENEQNERELTRKKEEQEYKYNLQLSRKKEQDQYLEEKNRREKEFTEREALLASREGELKDLLTRVNSFEEEKSKAVKAAEAILSNVLKNKYETEAKILAAETNAKLALVESEKNSLSKRVDELNANVLSLKSDLEKANNRVVEISQEALKSASGREAANALANVVNNQNNNSKSKG
jgi:chromosome segregation ATPase